ncbi:hypothetical protein evm_006956 [Chilo suppressalis]|nr:hypothetical protein evm_006956 [Chilo suppressalis]
MKLWCFDEDLTYLKMVWGFVTCGPNEALVVSVCADEGLLSAEIDRLQLHRVTQHHHHHQHINVPTAGAQAFPMDGIGRLGHYPPRGPSAVFEVASSDLINMGITVVSYTLKDIRDEEGYLKALGMARTAEVKRDARIGEAEAQAEAKIKEAMAEEQRMAARFLNDTEIAKAQRDFELKKAAYDVEVQTKKAEAEMAYELQAAKTKQRIKEEQMQIAVVERTQEIAVQKWEVQRREKELDSTIRRPAEAEKYRLEKLAEAHRLKTVLEAEAEAEAVKVRGEAEAFAIKAKAVADAEQMSKKAEAWKEYGSAAMVDMMLDTLPKVAAEVAAPLSQARKVTMVSCGGGEVGAAKLTGEVLSIVQCIPDLVKGVTGVDISKQARAL